tara:strand:- start:1528 stop:1752 length:225 start_codon:yes stop_codon:yes gene_type:complete
MRDTIPFEAEIETNELGYITVQGVVELVNDDPVEIDIINVKDENLKDMEWSLKADREIVDTIDLMITNGEIDLY